MQRHCDGPPPRRACAASVRCGGDDAYAVSAGAPGYHAAVLTLDQVLPWGRSFDEYCRMFALTDADLSGRILGCGDGPANFNAIATRRGLKVVSCDPVYRWNADDIR